MCKMPQVKWDCVAICNMNRCMQVSKFTARSRAFTPSWLSELAVQVGLAWL